MYLNGRRPLAHPTRGTKTQQRTPTTTRILPRSRRQKRRTPATTRCPPMLCPPYCVGCCVTGPTVQSPWLGTPPPWAIASSCCASASSTGVAPSPVAWRIIPATAKGSWQEPWLELLDQFHGLLSPDGTVVVLADRGLYAKWLFEAICKLGWHPLLRINSDGKFRPAGWHPFVPLSRLVPSVGRCWRGRGTAFATPAA